MIDKPIVIAPEDDDDYKFDMSEVLNEAPDIRHIYFATNTYADDWEFAGIVFETDTGERYPIVLRADAVRVLRRQLDKMLARGDNDILDSVWEDAT